MDSMQELKEMPIWVCWNRKEKDGRITKVPCSVDGGGTRGVFAAVQKDLRVWGDDIAPVRIDQGHGASDRLLHREVIEGNAQNFGLHSCENT